MTYLLLVHIQVDVALPYCLVIIGSWFSYRSIELRTYDMCKSYQFSDRFKLIKVAVPVINNVLLC